ncbi:hypothetical protein M2196_008557 [Bradyrhizobium elkanii]|nr:hypothetical protein [Bradyrhizobium elkanii]
MLDRTQLEQGLNTEDASQLLDQDAVAEDLAQDKGWRRPLGWLRRAGQFFSFSRCRSRA